MTKLGDKMTPYYDIITPQRILTEAIKQWQPVALIALFSGGYDSMVMTHILHRLDTHNLPIQVWSIDTQLAADGWHEYVYSVANKFSWDFQIYDNKKGYHQFVELVRYNGCPKSRNMHTFVFQKLKERGFDAIHMMNKKQRSDKTLFVSGMRRAESKYRENAAEIQRIGKSNKIFAAPIIHWTNKQCDYYRVEYSLPDNPFYDTVKGSGDCQCNWGDFITLGTLKKYSPNLAAGNVKLIDDLSKQLHGFGWHSQDNPNQLPLFENDDNEAELTTPFLCQNCSRAKVRGPVRIIEQRLLQEGLF